MEFIEKLKEAFFSVIPVAVIVILLHLSIAPLPYEVLLKFIIGTVLTIVGLGVFLRGVDIGISPMGERVGAAITKSKNIKIVVIVGFIIGVMITIAEPDVQILATRVDELSDVTGVKNILVFAVAVGVGLFVALGLVRIVMQFSLRKALIIGYTILFATAVFSSLVNPDFLAISFDSGGVTTGAMTVPFMLSLGLGVSSMRAGKSAAEDSFGIVGLASIGPILACLILGMML